MATTSLKQVQSRWCNYRRAGLNNLPAEIYSNILRHFPLDFPEIDWPTPRLNDPVVCQDLSQWEGRYVANLTVLSNLRLVSAPVHDAVMLALLKSVIITSPRQLVRFFRMILSTPQWGLYIRNLAVFVTLNRQEVANEIVRWILKEFKEPVGGNVASTIVWSADRLGQLAKDMGLPLAKGQNGTSRMTTADLAEGLLGELLLHTPNLVELALQMPFRSDMNATPGRPFWPMFHAHTKRSPPQIKTLQLRPDPNELLQSQQWEVGQLYNFDPMRHHQLLESFPALQTLKVANNSGNLDSLPPFFFPTNRDASVCWMHQTCMGPRAITTLLSTQLTPNLKKLTVTQRARSRMARNRVEIVVPTLEEALEERATDLRELHLIFDFTDDGQSSLIFLGTGHKISTLPKMQVLTSLTIQTQLLLGKPDALKYKPNLARMLPPNLETLIIRDEWAIDTVAREQVHQRSLGWPANWQLRNIHAYSQISSTEIEQDNPPIPHSPPQGDEDYYTGYNLHEYYRQCVRDMLLQLAADRQGDKKALPHLRKFSYQVLTTRPWFRGGSADKPFPTHQPVLEDLFRQQQDACGALIKFTPPRWLPYSPDDGSVQPCADWAIVHVLRAHFGDIHSVFAKGGVEFDWAGDAREWLDLLRQAAGELEKDFEQTFLGGSRSMGKRPWEETVEELFTGI